MCTAVVSVDHDSPVPLLLVGVRDEFMDRAWLPPDRHWPDRPDLIGGRDLLAGGTWLAVDPAAPRAACVLNGQGPLAPEQGRLSRGELPLLAASGGDPAALELDRFDPFHLIRTEPGGALLWTWDGHRLGERPLGPGLHLVVNSGLEGAEGALSGGPGETAVAQMSARIAHFRPRLSAAARPEPVAGGGATAAAWGAWLPLIDGDGVPAEDPRAMVLRREFPGGRLWGTGSVSLVALSGGGARYDFTATPGDPTGWRTVLG
ncbi:hypothetical protein DPM19_16860 [Actinomadura craniellae]|uniref:NRDE family protein n=1 Tax=Actinomadura craniellae TaxID=2231787 RepID=A0A365H4C6_9ACTN|nr:NRDE family protein [Actinomadura craniellae]RAY13964.1 hypothetical protein DPM19_16860 [Actinomadura craniellae]